MTTSDEKKAPPYMERLQKEQLYLYLDICVCISHGCRNVFLSIYYNICVSICILLEHLYFCICEGCINVFLSILAKHQIYPISLHPSPPMRPFPPPKAPKQTNKLVSLIPTHFLFATVLLSQQLIILYPFPMANLTKVKSQND